MVGIDPFPVQIKFEKPIDLSEFQAGIYNLQLTTKDVTFSRQLVIQ